MRVKVWFLKFVVLIIGSVKESLVSFESWLGRRDRVNDVVEWKWFLMIVDVEGGIEFWEEWG